MGVIFKKPHVGRKQKPAGVYKMTFDGVRFYIGSSSNLRVRFSTWMTALRRGVNKNKKIRELMKTCYLVEFEIIEIVADGSYKQREGEYIKKYWDDPLLLNYCPNPENCYGIRFSEQDLAARRKPPQVENKKPIAVFNMNWEFIVRFDFVSEAASYLGVKRESIFSFLQGKCGSIANHKVKLVNTTGEYIEPRKFVPKEKVARKKGYKFSELAKQRMREAKQKRIINGTEFMPDWNKPIAQYDKDGNCIAVHPSIAATLRAIGCKDRVRLRRLLNGKRVKSIYGFTFKYA